MMLFSYSNTCILHHSLWCAIFMEKSIGKKGNLKDKLFTIGKMKHKEFED